MTTKKKLIFSFILLVILYVFAEFSCYLAYRIRYGSFSSISQEKTAVISETYTQQKTQTKAQIGEGVQGRIINRTHHPYLGYVNSHNGLENGFLKQQALHRKSPQECVILILGGSVANSFYRQTGRETLQQELEKSPVFANKKLVFISLACGGYKQPQQYLSLNYFLALGGEFDMAINIDGFNDVALHGIRNAKKNISLAYPVDWITRIYSMNSDFMARHIGEILYLRTQRKNWAEKFSGILSYSVCMNFVWKIYDVDFEKDLYKKNTLLLNHNPTQKIPQVLRGPQFVNKGMYEELADMWARCSINIDKLCKAHNAQYFHFLQPNQYVADSKVFTEEEKTKAYRQNQPHKTEVEKGYPVLRKKGKELQEKGIVFRDLTSIFKPVKQTVYKDTCCHINDEGNRIMGKVIANEIRAHLSTE